MLVIVSDLHLGDGTCAKSISPGAFYLFTDRLKELVYHASWRADNRYRPVETVDLVLLGDILDPQHSALWLETRLGDPGYVRPWTDPESSDYAELLGRITRSILEHNADGISLLKACAEGSWIRIPGATPAGVPDVAGGGMVNVQVRIFYVVGNHDWAYRLQGAAFDRIRADIIDAFGLSNAPGPFPWEPGESPALSDLLVGYRVVARHGDRFDNFNYDS